MSIDLDEMFGALGRDADAVPLASPAQARRRGRQRSTRAVIAAAAAMCLIAAGVGGVTAWRDRHLDRLPGPVATLRPVGTPIDFGGPARAALDAGTDGRLYTAWQTLDGKIRVNAVDLRTGTVSWPARELTGGPGDTVRYVHALPQGVMVVVGREGEPGSTVHVYDPADGRQRWRYSLAAGDEFVHHRSVLVRMSAATGATEAFDWLTGRSRWTLPAPADRPVHTLGMWLPPGDDGPPPSVVSIGFTDDRLVQVTEAGKVQVRDITTGALRHTVTSVPPDKDPRTFVAYDGWLYNDEHECCAAQGYRIRATDLRSTRGGTSVLASEGAGHELGSLRPCGRLLCVVDQQRDGKSTLSGIDLAGRKRLWRVAAPDYAGGVSTVNGLTVLGGGPPKIRTVVLDQAGRQVFATAAPSVHWLDRDALILLPISQAGPVGKVTLPGGQVTPLGDVPATSDQCVATVDRLACPTSTELRVWSLGG